MQATSASSSNPNPQLIQRAQQGDGGAVSWLYAQYQTSVFRYLYYRTGDRGVAEDLTSDVFLRMLRALPHYRIQAAPFQAWLFQIARNLATDYFRQSRQDESLSEALEAPGLTPEAAAEQALTTERLRQALAGLGAEQREALIMRFVLKFSLEQTAQALGKSEDAIKGLQRRGLSALRQALGAEDQKAEVYDDR